MKIIFIDKNKKLVEKVKKAVKHFPIKIECICGDIFKQDGVIVSASNPSFSMGGGLDALIKKHYPQECSQVKKQGQIGNVMFTITVGDDFKATRETVDNALAFAMNEKNNLSPDQTLLISGLGTGIGGLDEDDFVWIFLKNLSIACDYEFGIKFTKKSGYDFYTGKVLYKEGKTIEELRAIKSEERCAVGLHLGFDFKSTGNYNIPEKIFFCIYNKEDLCHTHTDKVRVSKLQVIAELPRWLGYGIKGKEILKKINKKFNPEKYNPYKATKLPSLEDIKNTGLRNQVKNQVGDQVWDQVGDQVGDQVWDQMRNKVKNQVGNQVWDQVRNHVWNQVWNQVLNQVRNQVMNQVWDQVGNQVWNQVLNQVWDQMRITSYWAINIYFNLGITHWISKLLDLGIMVIFVQGKIKVFGKNGKYLGEYNESDLLK
jgi:hypothetical protein